MSFKQITIIGTGLIGGSFALAVKAGGFKGRMVGWDRQAVLERAVALSVIDAGYEDPQAAVQGSDLIVLSTPVGTIIDMIERIGPIAPPDALITDVGSTKKEILDRARSVFGSQAEQRFLAGHPMAGKEHGGVENAEGDMLHNAVWFLVPQPQQDLGSCKIRDYRELLEQAGLRIVIMDPDHHDRL